MKDNLCHIVLGIKKYIKSLVFSNVNSRYFIYQTYGLDINDDHSFYDSLSISCHRKRTKTGRLSPTYKIYYLSSVHVPIYNNWFIKSKVFVTSADKQYNSKLFIRIVNKDLDVDLFLAFGVNIDFEERVVTNIHLYHSAGGTVNSSRMFSRGPLNDFVIRNADFFTPEASTYESKETYWSVQTKLIEESLLLEEAR